MPDPEAEKDIPCLSTIRKRRRSRRDERAEAAGAVPGDRAARPDRGRRQRDWWPNRLNLKVLAKNSAVANPLGADFDYAAAFEQPRSRRRQAATSTTVLTDLAGLVAGGLRPLRRRS